MLFLRALSRSWLPVICSFAFAMVAAGCQTAQKQEPSGPLAAVSPIPKPSLPPMIVEYSPKGDSNTLGQIRVIFKDPLIAIERLESPDEQAKLAYFHIDPALPGQFRFLTPRMVGFQADRAIPLATRVRITVGSGLSDLRGKQLGSDFAWTFTTPAIALTGLPGQDPEASNEPADINPSFKVNSNVELDAASLADKTQIVARSGGANIGVTATLDKAATPDPGSDAAQTFDASQRSYIYTVKPAQPLDKGTQYSIVAASGVLPAHGNLPSDSQAKGKFTTYSTLKLTGADTVVPPGGTARFVRGDPQLRFNNGVDAASATAAISMQPAPRAGTKLLQIYDGDTTVLLNPWAFEPNRTYTITVAPTLKDQFGQSLGQTQTAQIATSNLSPSFWAPSGLNLFARTNSLHLDYSAVNLPNSRYRAAYRVMTPGDVAGLDYDNISSDNNNLLPKWQSALANAPKNHIQTIAVPVTQKLGAPVGLLAYAATGDTSDGSFYGMVGLTNLGVFAQWFPQNGFVAVQHLSDGSPAANAAVEIYRAKTRAPCAAGKTNAAGVLAISGVDVERCSAGAPTDGAPSLIAVAHEGIDWAYARLNDNAGYGYDVYLGWSNGKPDSRGTIFSDRMMYQPGERATFTGIAYYLQNGTLKRDAGATYALSIRDANGRETKLGSKQTDAYGVFNIVWAVKADQPLGYYTIKASGANGNQLYGDLRVAEFKPPNFNVTLSLDKKYASAGDIVVANGKSAYLFGAPLQGGHAHYYVTRSQTTVQPKDWDAYQFGRQWFWPEQAPSADSDVLDQTATLGNDGTGSQSVHVADDLPYPMSYRVDMEVTDVSNLSVSDSKTFTALPRDAVIGLQNDFVGNENQAFPVKVVVTDPAGARRDGVAVHVELQSMDYASATQLQEGGESAQNSVKYTTVDQADVTSGAPQTVQLKAPKAGSYRIRANFADAKSDASETDTQIWISGPDVVRWNSENPNQLKIALDKSTYRPGDLATALVQSPYPQGDLYFSVVREKTLYKTFVKVSGGAPRVTFRVTPEMLPNAAVEAVLVRRGKPIEKLAAGSLDSLVRIGLTAFSTNLDAKYLKLAIVFAKPKASPGATQQVSFALKDVAGHGAKGELAVMVVNDAILQLTGYRLPDLVKTVYAQQPISTRFSDNRPNVVLSPLSSPVAKGYGYGGGFMEGPGSTRVRRNFQPMAYYNGSLKTDANGIATVSFTLPDDLTTWRVMAVAVGGTASDFRFAVSDTTFISTKPLLANPLLPQFARTGDLLEGGTSVTNTTGQNGTLALDGILAGALRFADGNGATTHLSAQLPAGTQAFRFPMIAGAGTAATMRFDAHLGNQSDAYSVPFELRNQSIAESVTQSGATANTTSVPLAIAGSGGALDIWLGSSIVPQIVAPAERALKQESPPFAESSASRLAIAAALKALSQSTGQSVSINTSAEASADIAALKKLQREGGGLRPWPEGKADPFLSAYAATSLGAARAAGFPADTALVQSLHAYLAATLANPRQGDWCNDDACKAVVRLRALLGLSALGDTRTDFLSDIYAQRDTLAVADQARLARYLINAPGWASAGNALADKLQQNVYLTARNATFNTAESWSWSDSPVAAQSEVLRLLVARHAPNDLLDAMVRPLTIEHCNCSFVNTYATAQRLGALVDYVRSQPQNSNFVATVTFGSRNLGTATFAGKSAPAKQLRLTANAMPKSAGNVRFSKRGSGVLHYILSYNYELSGMQPGILSGLRVTRMVRGANQTPVLLQMGLLNPATQASLPAAQVYDIGLEIVTDHPVDHVMISDPLPAGLEAVDATFQTSTPYFAAKSDSWQIDYQTIYKDQIFAYADHLGPGVYSLHYLVRSVTPGTYAWPGAEAHLEFSPEEFGRTAATTLVIPQ